MGAATLSRAASGPAERRAVVVQPVTYVRVLRSEWIKVPSLRSTKITLAVAVVLMAGIGLMSAAITASQWSRPPTASRASFDAVATVLQGHQFAQLAIGVLGVMLVSSEYSTEMIRATLTAVPRRLPVLWAKSGLFTAVTLVSMTLASFAGYLGGMSLLSSHHLQTSLSAPGVTRAVIGAALYLTVVGLLGLALGALLRHTAGAIAALVGLLLLAPVFVNLLPSSVKTAIAPYLPSNAGAGRSDAASSYAATGRSAPPADAGSSGSRASRAARAPAHVGEPARGVVTDSTPDRGVGAGAAGCAPA